MATRATARLPCPEHEVARRYRYAIRARSKKTFNTVLDAKDLIDPDGGPMIVEVQTHAPRDGGHAMIVRTSIPVRGGRIVERVECDHEAGALAWGALTRTVENDAGEVKRSEEVIVRGGMLSTPAAAYPEVMLPFLIGQAAVAHGPGSLYAWINDRMVARVDFRTDGRDRIALDGPRRAAIKAVMYPDFNDWVSLPKLLSKLAYPFVPKYHFWFAEEAPHHVLRFEGPYGPPGAPEIVLELEDHEALEAAAPGVA